MSRYDGLIIPRSYSEYINKTDAATLQQALQLSGVLSGTVAAGDNKAVKSSAVNEALINLDKLKNIVVTSDTEFWNAITSMQGNKCNSSIIIGYTTPLFNNILGVIQCTIGQDTNMTRGVFLPLYGSNIYSLEINEVQRNVYITELARKEDLSKFAFFDGVPNQTYTIDLSDIGDDRSYIIMITTSFANVGTYMGILFKGFSQQKLIGLTSNYFNVTFNNQILSVTMTFESTNPIFLQIIRV